VPLLHSSLFVLFLIIALGLILGRVRVAGLSLDVSAVIFVALGFGACGLLVDPIFQQVGLIFFVFSVGIQSGPGFAASFRKNALTIVGPILLLVGLSAALVLGLAAWFGLDPRLALGLLTGARSSNSALAVGVSTTGSNLPALGHSIAYPLGVIGALLFVRLLPALFRARIEVEEAAWVEAQRRTHPPLVTKTFEVTNPGVAGRPLASLALSKLTGANLSRILHEGQITIPTGALVLAPGDLVKAVGTEADLEKVALVLGREVQADHFVEMPLDQANDAQWIVVANKRLVNKTLAEVGLGERFQATMTRLKRHEVELTPQPWSTLRYGDLVMVVCPKATMAEVRRFLGEGPRRPDADFLPLALTLVLGLALGSVALPLWPGFTFSFGITGGVLVTALVLGAVGKTGPILWHVHDASLKFIRQLGLLLFLSAVGTDAGSRLVTVFSAHGAAMVATAVAVSLLPLLVVALVGRFVLKLDIATLMGLVSGATTCSPALAAAEGRTTTNAATLAYAAAYPFAMLAMMVAAQLLALVPMP